MPIFEYKCEECGTKFEKLISRTADGRSRSAMPLRRHVPDAGRVRAELTGCYHSTPETKRASQA